jgi:hypothetical protein
MVFCSLAYSFAIIAISLEGIQPGHLALSLHLNPNELI